MAIKIFNIYRDKTIEVVKGNPYRLIEDVDGIGFKTADKIAKKMGIEDDSEFRIRAGIVYVLNQIAERQGSTVGLLREVKASTLSILELDESRSDLVDRALVSLEVDGAIRKFNYGDTEGVCLTKF